MFPESPPHGIEPSPPVLGVPLAVRFWLVVWLGTTVAGGLFGLWTDGFAGLISGVLLAGILAMVGQAAAAFFAWFFWLFRFQMAMAILVGSATGVIATASVFRHLARFRESNIPLTLVFAGILGALGAGLAGFWYRGVLADHGYCLETLGGRYRGPITRRDVWIRLAILAALAVVVARCFIGQDHSPQKATCPCPAQNMSDSASSKSGDR